MRLLRSAMMVETCFPREVYVIPRYELVRTSKVPLPLAIWFWQNIRKLVILVLGITILLLGIVMLVFPGPGWVTIFAGLSLLATEFAWARWALRYGKDRLAQLLEMAKSIVTPATEDEPPASTTQTTQKVSAASAASSPLKDIPEREPTVPLGPDSLETSTDKPVSLPFHDVIDTSANVIDERPASPAG